MRPIRLRMHNFMSYKDADIDLSDIGIAAIVGPNGSGKSTILQAITYALWGQVRTASHDDVVRRGSGQCAVSLDFVLGGDTFRVTRRRSLGSRGSSDLEFSHVSPDGQTTLPLTGPTIKETQGMIDNAIGMGYDVFANSALLQQGEASRFSDARPAQRKELLAEMLGLGWFQELEKRSRLHLKSLQADRDKRDILLLNHMEEIEKLGDLVDLDEIYRKLDLLKEKIKLAEEEIEKTRQEKERVANLKLDFDRKKKDVEGLLRWIQDLQEMIDDLVEEGGNIAHWPLRQHELLLKKIELGEKMDEDAAMAEKSTEYARLLALSAGLQETAQEHSDLFDDLCTNSEALNILRSDLKDAVRKVQECDEAHKSITEKALEIKEELLGYEATYVSLRERLEKLEGQSVCPTCGQDIDDPEAHSAEIKSAMEELEEKIWATRNALSMNLAESKSINYELSSLQCVADKLTKEERELSDTVVSLRKSVESLEKEHSNKAEAANALVDLPYNPEAHSMLKAKIAQLSYVETDIAKMESAVERLAKIDEELEDRRKRIEIAAEELNAVDEELLQLQQDLETRETEEELAETLRDWHTSAVALREMADNLTREAATAEANNQRIFDLSTKISEAKSKLGLMDGKILVAESLVAASSKTGAQALIIESVLPQIEQDANEYLASMSNNMKLLLESQKTAKSGNVSESLDVVVFADGMQAPIESLSGGERFRADLSLRLAVGKMLARRFGASVKMLAIDEGFGSLDGDGQESVLQVISSLAGFFDLILVISHVQSIAESIGMVGNMITVGRSGGSSTVRVV